MNNIYELEKTNSSESSREKTIIRTSIIGIIVPSPSCSTRSTTSLTQGVL